ncbi:bacterioferritin-associated ferredoxin [Saccharopolyspora lacisalsi]|uniref:Bacterioferritin-associated ferredoxin n=1 Tax=Halosaccharopolyspora lacisalsi TaxID=1000566 RepID=A0A839DSQ5_9PSEU|nr:(2Fe-2S)-binding protein [Halosaccharopolyspora lacisalsi]MBA8825022.1 bacterioferritin-associated ferredoxin [Halosaccharopolyspora lacisalsi]
MYACLCAAVTTAQVQTSILAGALTVEEVGDHCGAGTGCGSCVRRLQRMLDEARPREEEASPSEHSLPRSA